ncbi:LysR family transcriptional regulator [Sphingomonas spermidinifaciens]|uniref:LysR family transcriptional regulator n=1 Tax=Sphingomonas spermidinifaciens TaxID=1141889 RepID=A0A2A4B8S1_9SPHN|nr:LysR family transcriptional regulator [Sphingomonas spermidinifaciens]PCD04315.1 LysR family transcriptional regulator [Sphingomonas spermidinifaciens]
MDSGPGWELWRTFGAVMRAGSLSGAARMLGLTQPTAGRHIAELEAALGAGALFTRSARGLQPTETALALASESEAMAAAAAALVRTASAPADAMTGVVRISVSEVIGAEVLPPILAALRAQHPGLIIELLLTNASSDLLRRDADLAIRMTEPRQQALLIKSVGRIRLGFYAHRDYLSRAGSIGSAADLERHAIIGFDQDAASIRSIEAAWPDLPCFALRTDNQLAQLALIRAGCGIGVMQDPIAHRDPALVSVLPEDFQARMSVWIAMHEDLRSTRRMRLVFDALVSGMTAHIKAGSERQR